MSLPLSVCVCWSLLGGRVVGCIMQEAGDEPSQEGGWIEMRHSMTCFRGECIIQHRSSNLIPSLRYCRVFTVKNIWKIWFVSHWGTLICAAATPPLVVPKYLLQSQQLIQKATSFLVFCLLKSSHVTQFCYTPPLLADWNGSYQIQKANVGRGSLPQARWCSQYSGSRLFIKHLPSQMSTEMHNGQTWRQFLK